MGIYDRDYMDGTSERMDAKGRRYTAVVIAVGINALVWIAFRIALTDGIAGQAAYPEFFRFMRDHFTVSPNGVFERLQLHTLLTSCFAHEDLVHLLFNMYFLWILGEDVERIYGYRNFLALYVFCGIVAALAHTGIEVARHHEIHRPMLGASGAIMGIAVVASIFDPKKPVSLFGLVALPLRILVILYVVLDILAINGSHQRYGGDMVAHLAHLGGALAGLLFWKLDLRVFASPGRQNVGLLYRLRQLFGRRPARATERIPEELPREPVAQAGRAQGRAAAAGSAGAAPSSLASSRIDPATGQRVDQLLGKISEQGISSLTDEERAFLNESSKKYKRKL